MTTSPRTAYSMRRRDWHMDSSVRRLEVSPPVGNGAVPVVIDCSCCEELDNMMATVIDSLIHESVN